MHIRPAVSADHTALVHLERRCFEGDRISERSFRRFLKGETNRLLVAEGDDGLLVGYGLLLRHRGTSLARLYSLAIAPEAQGQGLGYALLMALEAQAETDECRFIRLEVHIAKQGAIALYQRNGYRKVGERKSYYEDGGTALLMEKRLHPSHPRPKNLPYFPQSTPFTCGPAALMMAMHQQDAGVPLNRQTELQLWREATTIYMTTGLGGTSPFGLALAAQSRGFEAQVWATHLETPFLDSVRSADKREVMSLVHQGFIDQCQEAGVQMRQQELTMAEIPELRASGWEILLLISTWRLNRNKAPHWVWLVGLDEDHAFLNDPDIDEDLDQSAFDNHFMPVFRHELDAMTRYGKGRYRAAVMVRK
ncbi:MAG: GNAT family N-acetyltransferase/peptidase C39 family protein [Saccharospirillum sp.]